MDFSITQIYKLGITAHRNGMLEEAEKHYRSVLKQNPKHAGASYNLGKLAVEVGQHEGATPFFEIAVRLRPKRADYWVSYLNNLLEQHQYKSAEEALERAKRYSSPLKYLKEIEDKFHALSIQGEIRDQKPSFLLRSELSALYEIKDFKGAVHKADLIVKEFPRYAFGWKILSIAQHRIGDLISAISAANTAIELDPRDAESHSNLGVLLQESGRLKDSVKSFKKALSIRPNFFEVHFNLGNALSDMRHLEEAITSYKKALQIRADSYEVYTNLGNLNLRLKNYEVAEKNFRHAIRLNTKFAEPLNGLALVKKSLGNGDEAKKYFNEAISLDKSSPEPYFNLGNLYKQQGYLSKAEKFFKSAIEKNRNYIKAHINLGVTLKEMKRFEEAEFVYRQALKIESKLATVAHSNLLFLLAAFNYKSSEYLEEAKIFGQKCTNTATRKFSNHVTKKSDQILRIGLVSGNFENHPVSYFLEAILESLRNRNIEIAVYATKDKRDNTTKRLQSLVSKWSRISSYSDEEAARLIYEDSIDILVDLSGHTEGNRLSVFSWKPAPIQVTWLGYFASTGLCEIDYILADKFVAPKRTANQFVEEIWQLPDSFLCFTPPLSECVVNTLPALSTGYITFGCCNKLEKISDQTIAVWSEILTKLEKSRLIIKDKRLQHEENCKHIENQFLKKSIQRDRLILLGGSPREEYLQTYNEIDIALSPFPFGGGTTTIEGLWMGVPAVIMQGNSFVSSIGTSIALNVGLSEWVAKNSDDYVGKALSFAADLYKLNNLRRSLREQLIRSPLLDAERFSINLENAFRSMVKRQRESNESKTVRV